MSSGKTDYHNFAVKYLRKHAPEDRCVLNTGGCILMGLVAGHISDYLQKTGGRLHDPSLSPHGSLLSWVGTSSHKSLDGLC